MITIGTKKAKLYKGNTIIKQVYLGAKQVYPSGNTVTYMVDSNVSYAEEVDEGASCLSPKTFTPSKSGWTFVGWREDRTASGSVLTSKVMGDVAITLYAVFRVGVTVTYYNNAATASHTSGYRYYNNGNTANPSFTLSQAARSGWSTRGWSTSIAGNGGITYNNATAFTITSNITLYGMYQQAVTLSYNGNSATSGSMAAQTGTVYYNSNGNTTAASLTVKANGFSRTNFMFVNWALGSTESSIRYSAGNAISLTANATLYAIWKMTTTAVFNYTGNVQTFTVPVTGTYKLEVWGAQGGKGSSDDGYTAYEGGKGGYSVGYINLTKSQILYICVGGGGNGSGGNAGSGTCYNGGGRSTKSNSNGGGATHIALNTNRGVLSNYASYKSEILIVAGGGGGSVVTWYVSDLCWPVGGSGGGASGGNGAAAISGAGGYGTGGTQTVAGGRNTDGNGAFATIGGFGYGGPGQSDSAGGGGGWYGGGGGHNYNGDAAGGGGSGYIGGVTNASTSNGVRSGNGYAQITQSS